MTLPNLDDFVEDISPTTAKIILVAYTGWALFSILLIGYNMTFNESM